MPHRRLEESVSSGLRPGEILQTPSGESGDPENLPTPSRESSSLDVLARRFPLPWSVYVSLLSVKSEAARHFYETGVLRADVPTPEEEVKDPYVLEFLLGWCTIFLDTHLREPVLKNLLRDSNVRWVILRMGYLFPSWERKRCREILCDSMIFRDLVCICENCAEEKK